jgi:two-component system response regulator GlrR
LYYRLCVLAVDLPPLRERQQDIAVLARHFLIKHQGTGAALSLSLDATRALLAYSWPGNVRELENVIQRAIAMAAGATITEADLGLADAAAGAAPGAAAARPAGHSPAIDPELEVPSFSDAKRAVVEAFERDYLQQVLRAHRGNVSRAAHSARKERRDFGRLLKKHQLDPRTF